MKPGFLIFLWPLVALAADDPAAAARAALDAGIPQAAIHQLDTAFPPDSKAAKQTAIRALRAEALCKAGRPLDAIQLLSPSAKTAAPEERFWHAQALAAVGEWIDALPLYSSIGADADPTLHQEATIGAARMETNLGHSDAAVKLLTSAKSWPPGASRTTALLDLATIELDRDDAKAALASLDLAGDVPPAFASRRQFLEARAKAVTGDDAGAIELFSTLNPTDDAMAVSAIITRAACLRKLGRRDEAENLLEAFIETRPQITGLDTAFAALDTTYHAGTTTSTSELKRWSEDRTLTPRKTLATFYLALVETRQDHPETAIPLFRTFLSQSPESPLAETAVVELATALLRQNQPAEALAILPPLGKNPSTDFVRGIALSIQNDPTAAVAAFLAASSDTTLAEVALYNAAVCESMLATPPTSARDALIARFPDSPRIPRLELIEAFELARKNDPAAAVTLTALAEGNDPETAGPAALALAELKFLNGDPAAARKELRTISTESDPARKAALGIFLDATGENTSPDAAITAAQNFLKDYPGSTEEPEVRMKLGELLFKKGDFGGARMQFEALARKFPATPFEEPALFLAGQSSARLLSPDAADQSMLLFEEVAALKGSFALRARFEQAVLQNSLDRPDEAVVILDRILASQPDPDTRSAALMEKGKTFFVSDTANPDSLRRAIAAWRQIADDPDASPAWKNQALARIGTAYEKLGETDAAIAAFYEVIKPDDNAPQEYFWFYKAGFDAGRILESARRWDEALRIYKILASTTGTRAAEAETRINKIRLENFIWEDK